MTNPEDVKGIIRDLKSTSTKFNDKYWLDAITPLSEDSTELKKIYEHLKNLYNLRCKRD